MFFGKNMIFGLLKTTKEHHNVYIGSQDDEKPFCKKTRQTIAGTTAKARVVFTAVDKMVIRYEDRCAYCYGFHSGYDSGKH